MFNGSIIISIHYRPRWCLSWYRSLSLSFLPTQDATNTVCWNQHCTALSDIPPRIATFFAATNLCGTFAGLLAAAIDQINEKSGKPAWAWIFILVQLHANSFLYVLINLDRKVYLPSSLVWSLTFFSRAHRMRRISWPRKNEGMSFPCWGTLVLCQRTHVRTTLTGLKSSIRPSPRMCGFLLS